MFVRKMRYDEVLYGRNLKAQHVKFGFFSGVRCIEHHYRYT